jgi:restriction endonuclease Mrr
MAIPTRYELALPILRELVHANMTTAELEDVLAKQFELTEDERTLRKSPGAQRTFVNEIEWSVGRVMGKGAAGFVEKLSTKAGRGVYGITESGRSVLSNPPSRIDHEWLC